MIRHGKTQKKQELFFENIEQSYDLLPALVAKLKNRNHGSHIVEKLENSDNTFQRLFVRFKACVQGFKDWLPAIHWPRQPTP